MYNNTAPSASQIPTPDFPLSIQASSSFSSFQSIILRTLRLFFPLSGLEREGFFTGAFLPLIVALPSEALLSHALFNVDKDGSTNTALTSFF